jgi:hypothetical protein
MSVTNIVARNGKFIVTLTNTGTESLNGDIWINFLLLN